MEAKRTESKRWQSRSAAGPWLGALLIVGAGVLVTAPRMNFPLHGPDVERMLERQEMQRLLTAPEAFDVDPLAPLTVLLHGLVASLTGVDPLALYGLGIAAHVASAILLFYLLLAMQGEDRRYGLALIEGTVFAVWPAALAATTQVAYHGPLFGAVAALAGCLIVARIEDAENDAVVRRLVQAGIAFAIAFGFHAMYAVAPLAAILVARDRLSPNFAGRRWRVMGALAFLFALLVTVFVASGMREAISPPRYGGIGGFLLFFGDQLFAVFGPRFPYEAPLHEALFPGWSYAISFLSILFLGGMAVGVLIPSYRLPSVAALPVLAILGAYCFAPYDLGRSSIVAYWTLLAVMIGMGAARRHRPPSLPMPRRAIAAIAVGLVIALIALQWNQSRLHDSPAMHWYFARFGVHSDPAAPHRYYADALQRELDVLSEGDRAKALPDVAKAWTEVIGLDPDDSRAYRSLATVQIEQEAFELAEANLLESLRRDPLQQEAKLMLANLYQARSAAEPSNRGFQRTALGYYESAARGGALPPDALAAKALLLGRFGRYEEALAQLDAALGPNPEGPLAQTRVQLQALAQRAQAVQREAQQALSRQPGAEGPSPLLLQAETFAATGQHQRAFYMLASLLRREPENRLAWALMAAVQADAGSPEGFIAEYGASFGGVYEAWRTAALRCGAMGFWDAAQTYLEHAASRIEGSAAPLLALAQTAGALRQGTRQEQYLRQAADAYPEDFRAWLGIAAIEQARGNAEAFETALREATSRGAPEDAIAQLRSGPGGAPAEDVDDATPSAPVRTIIR